MATRSGLSEFGGACGATATVFGVLAGIGGVTHGIGEVLQGNVAVEGIAIDSWTTGPIARNMGGEPGITVMPTALWAGVVTLVFSLAVVAWSLAGVRRNRGGTVLILLSAGMLVAGGGVGPPVIGVLAGVIGRWSGRRQPNWIRRRSIRIRSVLAKAWPPIFALATLNTVFLVVGSTILVYTIDLNRPGLFEASFYLSVLMLLFLVVTAPAYDAQELEVTEKAAVADNRQTIRGASVRG